MSADNLSLVTNGTMNLTMCDLQPNNPYCGIYGPQRVVEAVYMTLLVVIGTIGNLMVIFSIMLEKRIHKNGNIFIINLAVADIFVTGFFLPTVLANVIYTGNSLNKPACDVAGYVITLTCVCSVSNLTVIAINRYWAVVKNKTYAKMFSKRRVYIMVLLVWVWSNLLVIPTLFGWSGLTYDEKMMECAWDDMKNRSYNIFLVVCAILLPVGVIVFCYYNLYKSVRSRGAWARSATSVGSRSNDRQRRSLQHCCMDGFIELGRQLYNIRHYEPRIQKRLQTPHNICTMLQTKTKGTKRNNRRQSLSSNQKTKFSRTKQ
uniref:melatonin receptor type 1B-A-like isoform X2 n=1 Tax=Ciona intestinalis TaxID=7719 RepID=UPI000EF54E97|nr:melatonin receptor type 1B-A-like isoform X2 [Ciona intestinalis]|eukprot:XP_026689841.1 melatonin receptor type 1B-A-like isoform X2 [Ciona intestinalis]